MADAAEEVAGLPIGMLRLKWPNDIVVAAGRRACASWPASWARARAWARPAVTAVVGIGVNIDWPRDAFPAELADSMTSLREVSRGRPVDSGDLLDAFLLRLEPRVLALRDGHFDVAGWHDRQVTTGRDGPARDAGRRRAGRSGPSAWTGRRGRCSSRIAAPARSGAARAARSPTSGSVRRGPRHGRRSRRGGRPAAGV